MPQGCEILPNGAADPTLVQPLRVQVIEQVGAATTFVLSYDVNIASGDYALLGEPRLGPDAELAVRVRDGLLFAVLVRGQVTRQCISLVSGGDGSVLDVIGADATAALGREARVQVWPATTDAAAILQLLGAAGLAPVVVLPSTVVHTEMKNALVQRESDLHLIRRLARRNGCWLWLEYDPVAAIPVARVERPPAQLPALVQLHLAGSQRNIDTVTIEWDVDRVSAADAANRDTFGASDIDGSITRSPLSGLADRSLADITTQPRKARLTAAVDDAGDLMTRSEAALIEDGWFVRASVTASQRVLGHVVRAPSVVELHGAGTRHSGRYIVGRVVHRIDDDDHWMDMTLLRNGWN